MKKLLTIGIVAALLGAAPAFADDDDKRHRHWGKHSHKHWDKHAEKHWKKHHKHWAKHHHHNYVYESQVVYAPPAVVEQRVVTRVVERPVFVAPAPQPAPGIHIVTPNIFVPF